MRKLKQVLQQFYIPYIPPDVLGESEDKQVDVNSLVIALNQLKADLNRRAWINIAMIVAVFLICIGITLIYLKKPQSMVSVFSALGVGVGWAVIQMNKLWKEIAKINLIIVLSTSLKPAEINEIIQVLIKSN